MSGRRHSGLAATCFAWGAVLALVVLIGWSLLPQLRDSTEEPSGDEIYYVHYLEQVGAHGLGAFPELFREYLGDSANWIFPPPSRVGFVVVGALWSKIFGADRAALTYLSLASHLALVAVTFAFARRWLGEHRSVLVAALVAFAPLQLGLARLALTDAFISLAQSLCIWLFLEYIRSPNSRGAQLGFAAAFGFACLSKEISVLLAIPLALLAVIERVRLGSRVSLATTLVLFAAPVVGVMIVWIAAAGGVAPLWQTVKLVMSSPATNIFAIRMGSGGWYRYPIDELLMSPWTSLIGISATGLMLVRWWRGEYDTLRVGMALVYVCQIAVLASFTKNLRYVAVLETPLRVLVVLLSWEFCASQRHALGRAACTGLVALLCWADFGSYRQLCVRRGIADPVTRTLAYHRNLLGPASRSLRPADEPGTPATWRRKRR